MSFALIPFLPSVVVVVILRGYYSFCLNIKFVMIWSHIKGESSSQSVCPIQKDGADSSFKDILGLKDILVLRNF